MVLKRRISSKWRLFLPHFFTLTAMLVVMSMWQLYRERTYRREFINQQLTLVTDRIATLFGNGEDVSPFLNFIETYYARNRFFSSIHIAIFNRSDWRLADCTGQALSLTDEEKKRLNSELNDANSSETTFEGTLGNADNVYYARAFKYPDGKEGVVIASLPDDLVLDNYIESGTDEVWIVALIFALIAYTTAYFSARSFGKSINILRELANRSVTDPTFIPSDDFTHDELGDIARRIIEMYNARAEASQRLEREHAVAMHAIEEKAIQKRQLTNNINHELKTPIGVIKGYLDILADETLDEKTSRHFITKAREHADRLAYLIQDVSAITRLDEGREMISTERLDFHDVAYTFAADVAESGVLGKMKFSFEVPLGSFVKGNYNLLNAMLINFAKNSANYSKGTYCRLETIAGDDTHYYFRFFDNGIGVAREHLPYLFERFYRIDSGRARKSGGTGLGLAIVYNTIIAHGGSIKASLHETGGLQFDFTLPKWS